MRLEDIRIEPAERGRRLVGRVSWEGTERTDYDLYFEVPRAYASRLPCRAEPLVAAACPAASMYGEERLAVEGDLCPRLRRGLNAVLRQYCSWYDDCRPIEIEVEEGLKAPSARGRRRTGLLLSGGVDSLALLREKLVRFAPDHPERVRECVLVFGLNSYDFRDGHPVPDRLAAFDELRRSMERLTAPEELTLVPVYTNVRQLYPDYDHWYRLGTGGGIVASGLALAHRITDLWVGSDGLGVDVSSEKGLHYSVAHLFSSAAVHVHYGQPDMRRLEKTRLLAGWEEGLAHLRTCLCREVQFPPYLNCGDCEKCVRTMLALAALGVLDRADTYPRDDLDPELIRRTAVSAEHLPFYAECIGLLESRGRGDLAEAVRRKLDSTGDRVGGDRPPDAGILRRWASWLTGAS